ncbi:hypothetical protein HO173_006458 [Letharia columbiana]|uniref:Uncharacterized protein n=1 Tax=Letharia columbiana TaxID=112416 RepID=A0A8H6FV36_9LECA|nr:uncharacterized protein HO173_006458 [Letharia columbiana]KAF6235264.1 hypothetical protein HO173_006458 [Letharia columbiana]
MELLPIIIIVSLLGFFIILTAGLFTWQYLKAREQHKRRLDSETQERPTRHLTVRSGQVIPKSEAAETASTRDPASFDLIRPKATYTVKCEAERRKTSDTWPPKVSTHRQDNPSKATDIEAQSKDAGRSKVAAYTWPPKPAARSQKHPFGSIDLEGQTQDSGRSKIAESECFRRKEEMAKVHAKLSRPVPMTQRSGSLTLPRPALVTIESRRPSAAKSNDSQSRQTSKSKSSPQSRHPSSSQNREIAESLQRAYTGQSIFGGEARQLPVSPILWNSSLHTAESRRASGRRSSGRSADGSIVSSRVISDSVQRPPPLFSTVDYSPHVTFAPVQNISHGDDDVNRVSFLSMTDSASSSYTTEQVSPVLRAPPPSINELIQYETSPPVSSGLVSYMPDTPGFVRDTPPQLDTPDFGNMSFFDSTRSSDESSQLESPKKLQRGVSVMSNRSILTIASSEISSNWTIGNAQVVNIYPSVAQEKDRATPPYARRLRSKYGRFPRGRGDKALPGIPKSPLWQNDFGDVHE